MPVRRSFACCTTTWNIQGEGPDAPQATEAAVARVHALERVLNAFSPESAVARLNREGRVRHPAVAYLVRRAQEYARRTNGAFDVSHGSFEHDLKAYIQEGEPRKVPRWTRGAQFSVQGDTVTSDGPLDLNGIAKGYIVDQAALLLKDAGVRGFVDGGGDMSSPTGPVAVASPYDDSDLGFLHTEWNIATSGGSRRRRGPVDHLYDPRDGHVGARHDQVTVLAKRDALEADVLATTLSVLTLDEGFQLLQGWNGVEALWVDDHTMRATRGFSEHVWRP